MAAANEVEGIDSMIHQAAPQNFELVSVLHASQFDD
jgi:hypothetical protein